jgi:protein-S-isoprenylcysteine O-methyltransferase Ste14
MVFGGRQAGIFAARLQLKVIFYGFDIVVFLTFSGFVVSMWQWDVRYFLGLGIAVVSFPLWMLARAQLGNSFSLRAQARALVTTGLYSKIRNPIYLFGELSFVGLFLAWGHWIGIFYVALIIPVQILRIRKEQRVLEQAFGDAYREYRARTWF